MNTLDGPARPLAPGRARRNAAALLEASGPEGGYLAAIVDAWPDMTQQEQWQVICHALDARARCRAGTRGKVLRADFRRHVAAP